jgi:hypothetical protein
MRDGLQWWLLRYIHARQVRETQASCRKNPDATPPGFIQEKPTQFSFFLIFPDCYRGFAKNPGFHRFIFLFKTVTKS